MTFPIMENEVEDEGVTSRSQRVLSSNGQPEAVRPGVIQQAEFWERQRPTAPARAVASAAEMIHQAIADYQPTHIVAMVSGGRDSAAAYEMAEQLGLKVDLILHGRTGAGIEETTEFVRDYYGKKGPDFVVADAGDAYERYVTRKGFFGVGKAAHHFAYHVLKADPFRAAISKHVRKRRRDIRPMLLNGARKLESENRKLNLRPTRLDKGNLWVNIIHDWSAGERDQFNEASDVALNPVAVQLCRSGECFCGTQQSKADRLEAAALYPGFGARLNALDAIAKRKFGFGWGDPYPEPRDPFQGDLFEPLCSGCATVTSLQDSEAA